MASSVSIAGIYSLGYLYRLEGLVGEYHPSMYGDSCTGVHDDHFKDSVPFTKGIHDLLCDGSSVRKHLATDFHVVKYYYIQCTSNLMRGLQLPVLSGFSTVQRPGIQGGIIQKTAYLKGFSEKISYIENFDMI